jgi:hypothetical protein
MDSKETIEIIREARKAGMQVALLLFFALLSVSLLFGLYIYKSFETNTYSIEASQSNETGDNTITQGSE